MVTVNRSLVLGEDACRLGGIAKEYLTTCGDDRYVHYLSMVMSSLVCANVKTSQIVGFMYVQFSEHQVYNKS